ncbi:hypothetical protein PybrP1_010046 [[Pythium] brassicae (nom. inval.)]|nr:hypothetical protein PybrP1_010046 [[Pythium] brassicae (nom. inval.)]
MKVLSADALRKTQRGNDDFDAMLAHDAYEVVMRDLMWKNVNYYITYALVFFAVFLASLFSHIPATDAMYQLGYSVSSTLAASGGDTITTDSTIKFANTQTISDTFDWLTDTFVPSVFVTEDYNGKALEKDKWGRVAMFNKFLLDLYPNCYDPDHVTVDSVVISFDTNASTAAALINQLKDRGDWLSSATQKVEITVVTYNGQVEAYTVTDLTVTFHQGGFVEPSSSTTPALSDPLKGTHTLVLAALVGILLIGRFVVVVIKRRRMTNVTDFRLRRMLKAIGMDSDEVNIDFEWVVIIPIVAFYATVNELVKTMTSEAFQSHLARLDGSDKTFGVDSEERKGLGAVTDSLKQVAWLTVSLRFVAVIAVLLVGAMVLKAFHKHPRLGILTRTLDRSLRAFRSVFGVFIIVFVSFSASGTVLFGDRAKSFSSFGTSLETCINMLFGSFEYAAIQDMYISAPMLFYWTYMVVVSLVLLNMMLAIVLDAYTSYHVIGASITKSMATATPPASAPARLGAPPSSHGPLRVTPAELGSLQHATDRIRNICILAHVDHGKTTLSDSLVSSNGLISEKLAGKIRFLDNTAEEQLRGITMKSSAISLVFQGGGGDAGEGDEREAPHLINLVDSPGHVDFSFDVSTAVRLCDGALVLIDAVEGVCAQTHAVLRQAWQEGIRACLVINKLDRLIFELQYSPHEAYQRVHRILEQTNAVMSSLIRADVLARHDTAADDAAADAPSLDDEAITNETEELENELLFSPASGNVLFASAVDGWAFSLGSFAQLYAQKLELPVRAVRQALWGDFYYHSKTKKIVAKPPSASSQTMFCAFVLEPIWTTYKALASPVASDADVAELRKLLRQLRVGKLVSDRELRATDRRLATQAVMRRWLPLSAAVLKMVARALPSPVAAQARRAEKLCAIALADLARATRHAAVFRALQACDTRADAPAVVYICKMISVEASVLSDCHRAGYAPGDEIYVGVGRVYAGVLRAGQPIYVLDPKFQGYYGDSGDSDAAVDVKHVTRVPSGVLRPYMLMGRELHALESVPAGNIVGLVGLHEHVLKTATLSTTLACPSLTKMPYQAKPIVRVAVEPEDPRHFAALEAGLQRLYRSDPTVEVHVQETGEHVVVALGELHLERCIKDLKERFAKVAVRVSEPLVGFRESIAYGSVSSYQETVVFKDLLAASAAGDPAAAANAATEAASRAGVGTTPDGSVTLRVRAVPLPVEAAKLLEESADVLRRVATQRKQQQQQLAATNGVASAEPSLLDEDVEEPDEDAAVEETAADRAYAEFASHFDSLLRASDDAFWRDLPLARLWSCGPRRVGPNMLINNIPGFRTSSSVFAAPLAATDGSYAHQEVLSKLENSIVTGFQVASAAGPLCDEPVWGVAFVLEDVTFHDRQPIPAAAAGGASSSAATDDDSAADESNKFGPLSGQVISTMRSTCRVAFVKQPVRLVEAIYDCTVQCQAEQLGKLYSVIAKRRGDVYAEELSDGTALFTVRAHVPVVESFGFATDLLIQTSGAASNPQLVFAHWRVMALDPFFQPQTEAEREDFGERVSEHNYVRRYIEAVRKRKGLARDEKVRLC